MTIAAYGLLAPLAALARDYAAPPTALAAAWQPTPLAFPAAQMPVVLLHGGRRTLGLMRWGWSRGKRLTDDAALEAVVGARASAQAWRERRCAVPCDVHYSEEVADGRLRMIANHTGGGAFIGGIWSLRPGGGHRHGRFLLLTRPAPPDRAADDDRSRRPVLLARDRVEGWLDPGAPDERLLAMAADPEPAGGHRHEVDLARLRDPATAAAELAGG